MDRESLIRRRWHRLRRGVHGADKRHLERYQGEPRRPQRRVRRRRQCALVAERERSGNSDPNSFEAISQNYNRYKWSKIFEQEFVALASGFVSETAPAVLELSRNVNGLTGPVEEQYAQWRVLLRGLFEIEAEGLNAAEAQTP